MTRSTPVRVGDRTVQPTELQRIVVGVGRDWQTGDAVRLAKLIARATGGELMLVAVAQTVPSRLPGAGETEAELEARLHVLQALMTPACTVAVERERTVADGLTRVVAREHADLLALGSGRHAREGQVRIGRRTRQLLSVARSAIAVAPRGLASCALQRLSVIGVGYDGTAESSDALRQAESLARSAAARLRVRAVVDDRLLSVGWTPTDGPNLYEMWDDVIEPRVESLREDAERAVSAGVDAVIEAGPGRPHEELIALSGEVDLLVIGSGRWGGVNRALLGTTGEQLMRQARCSVLVVPHLTGTSTVRRDLDARPGSA